MPELPEVETIRRDLERHLTGSRVARVHVLRPEVVLGATPEELDRALRGARFRRFARRGKYLLVELDEPAAGRRWLVIHLRMTGRLTLARRGEPLLPHTHVVFELETNPGRPWEELRFSDVRRFGRLYLLQGNPLVQGRRRRPGRRQEGPEGRRQEGPAARRPEEPGERRESGGAGESGEAGERAEPQGLLTLGPEPLSRRFTAAELGRRLAGRRAPIKALLLDQRVVAGLGNIYADEALFRARIHPARPAGALSSREVARLARAIRRVLREAVDAGGTTFSDYRDGLGREGQFVRRLAVYDRAGDPCPRCGTPVSTLRLGGRTAHFCPRCQPAEPATGPARG